LFCWRERLVEHFGLESFDAVISTEVLEHVFDRRTVVNNMKTVLKPAALST
jgi:2-polyprenyl-3-methyl-5-hydroxy-6-metoxy-1,4-benzoquinol methylase